MLGYIVMVKKLKFECLPEILTLQQVCEVLNCHPNTLRNWDKEGVLKALRFGKRRDRRYRKADVLKIIKKR